MLRSAMASADQACSFASNEGVGIEIARFTQTIAAAASDLWRKRQVL
jgi:hypothetical protein